jgi:hypothetical protein
VATLSDKGYLKPQWEVAIVLTTPGHSPLPLQPQMITRRQVLVWSEVQLIGSLSLYPLLQKRNVCFISFPYALWVPSDASVDGGQVTKAETNGERLTVTVKSGTSTSLMGVMR